MRLDTLISLGRRSRGAGVLVGAVVALLGAGSVATVAAQDVPEPPPIDSLAAPAAVEPAPMQSAADSAAPATPPTPTAAASANPRLTGTPMVRLVRKPRNVVRAGPGDRFAIVAVRGKGEAFPVVAKNGNWYGVKLSETETGWIHASLCKEYEDLSNLQFRPNPRLYSRTGSFVLAGYTGAYSFDRKSNSLVAGGRLGYYVFDRFQAEAGVAWTHVRRPEEIVESLFGLSLEAEDFHMLFYHLNVVWEVLPGRQMVPFLSGGVGSSIMLGKSEASFNYGAGTTLFLSRRTAMRWEFRNYRFKTGSEGARLTNNNIEFTLGTSILF